MEPKEMAKEMAEKTRKTVTKAMRLAIGKLTPAEEVARVARQVLDIPPLPVKRLLQACRKLARLLERQQVFGARNRRIRRATMRVNGLGYSASSQAALRNMRRRETQS